MNAIRSEEQAQYTAHLDALQRTFESATNPTNNPLTFPNDEAVLTYAAQILSQKVRGSDFLASPDSTREYLRTKLYLLEHEVFGAVFLDNKHRVLDIAELFRGTVDGASVYPREVVKEALAHNAVALVLYHNHPSGNSDPSTADIQITQRLKDALSLVDIRILDHLIIGDTITSLAERGQI